MTHSRTEWNRIGRMIATVTAFGMLWVGATQWAAAQSEEHEGNGACSTAAVAGVWGYTEVGTVFPSTGAAPMAAIARYTLDREGNMLGSATSSSGGNVSNVTLKGSATVNADCTGSLTVGVYSLSGNLLRTVTFALLYGDKGSESRGIVTSSVLANGVIVPAVLTIDAKKLNH